MSSSQHTKRVLAVAAHPDDIEILCAGTMARYAELGCEVTLCNATNGSRGSMEMSMEETARVRDAEARRSAEIIGARYVCLEIEDCELNPTDLNMRQRFVDLIRGTNPTVVFTHHPDDYHSDHVAASKLTFDASFMAAVPLLETARPPTQHILPLYYMDTLAGLHFSPEEYVDITPAIDTKRRMLAEHQSQVSWMREHDHLDLLDFMETQSRFRGYQARVGYAEGFVRAHTWLRNSAERLLP